MELPNRNQVASFDIDPQYTFTPVCPEELPVPGGDEIADELNALASYANFRIGSKDAHSTHAKWVANADAPQFSPVDGPDMDIRWNSHAVPGTKGFEFLESLPAPRDYDYFVWKGIELDMHPYGACYHDLNDKMSTGVVEVLTAKGVTTVLCGGLALDYCVKTTVMQLIRAGFHVIVNLAACRGIAEDSVNTAIEEMKTAGVIFISDASELKKMKGTQEFAQ